jgi:DNA helicase-2/ATP-dependent DNA helicase PcrA
MNINAFIESANNYEKNLNNMANISSATDTSIYNFLDYIELSDDINAEFDTQISEEVNENAVQLLTIHKSKGLEWDTVVVAGNSSNLFLGTQSNFNKLEKFLEPVLAKGKNSLTNRKESNLPAPLTLEYKNLPKISFNDKLAKPFLPTKEVNHYKHQYFNSDYKDLPELNTFEKATNSLTQYENELNYIASDEPKRLIYVALTRAKTNLMISGAVKQTSGVRLDQPSAFFYNIFESNNETKNPDYFVDVFKRASVLKNNSSENDKKTYFGNKEHLSEKQKILQNLSYEIIESEYKNPESQLSKEYKHKIDLINNFTHKIREIDISFLSVTERIRYKNNRQEFIDNKLRPVPIPYSKGSIIGTKLHEFIDTYLNKDKFSLLKPLQKDFYKNNLEISNQVKNFIMWLKHNKHLKLVSSEMSFSLIDNQAKVNTKGKIDAVFYDNKINKYIIVDWKSFKESKDKTDNEQLKIYKKAFAQLKNINEQDIITKFVYLYGKKFSEQTL